MMFPLFISCPRGLEYLLEAELIRLGLEVKSLSPQGVYGEASLEVIYQICLWSRLANRVHLLLCSGPVNDEASLRQLAGSFPWHSLFSVEKRFAVQFHGTSDQLRNSMYGAQLVKDSIADHFRGLEGRRPDVDRESPDILIQAYLNKGTLSLSLDLVGYSLHQRGYRTEAGLAPLKENLAAALLVRANWPALAAEGYAFCDPLCGSGTLVIEAAMMAAKRAPGLLREDQALANWLSHQPSLWEQCREAARALAIPLSLPIYGSDQDPQMIERAIANAGRAGLDACLEFSTKPFSAAEARSAKGLLVTNPPYGERLEDGMSLLPLYQELGKTLHGQFANWKAAFLTSNPMLAKATGLRSNKQYRFLNGAIDCKLYCLDLAENQLKQTESGTFTEAASMFANRFKKNFQHLQKWAKRQGIEAYRIYDADLPDYAFAVDYYRGYAVVQEYAPPASVPAHKAESRRLDVLMLLPGLLGIPRNQLILKERKPQKGTTQYQRLDQQEKRLCIPEGKAQYYVNLYDYLDTGVFLDHRKLRLQFAKIPAESRFLNCFCYTATASVQAALAGAITTNVDLSKTYLRWAEDNFDLNNLDRRRHQFIQMDCLAWLQQCQDRFDTIFLDPPSFSNSKRMEGTLDIQRDHVALIDAAMGLLAEGGQLYFSCNLRSFKLDPLLNKRYQVLDLSLETIDEDFKRNPKIHCCFKMTKPL